MTVQNMFSISITRLRQAACFVFTIFYLTACIRGNSVADKPVVNVSGKNYLASDFAKDLTLKLRGFDALTVKDPQVVNRAKEELVRDFVIQVLCEDWAKANGVFVRAEDLEAEIKKMQASYSDAETFEKMLVRQGLSFKAWKELLQKSLLQKLVAQKLNEHLSDPNEDEIKSYYQNNKELFDRPEQVQIRQIVVNKEADAKVIEEALKKGKTLAELAHQHSVTPEGKRSKGVLPWLEKGSFEIFDPAFSMKVGQRSGIVKSAFGYHIFELVGRRPAQLLNLENSRPIIQKNIAAKRSQALFTAWLEAELRKARILKDQELLNKIRVETKED